MARTPLFTGNFPNILQTPIDPLVIKLTEHDAALDAVGAAGLGVTINTGALTGRAAKTAADSQTSGSLEVVYVYNIADAATANYDIIVDEKIEVFDVRVIKSAAGAANTAQLFNGATAISDAMAAAVDKTVTRCATLDPAQVVVAAGGTLRVTFTRAAGSGACKVFVNAVKRP